MRQGRRVHFRRDASFVCGPTYIAEDEARYRILVLVLVVLAQIAGGPIRAEGTFSEISPGDREDRCKMGEIIGDGLRCDLRHELIGEGDDGHARNDGRARNGGILLVCDIVTFDRSTCVFVRPSL
jgi:hypothetical protein